MAERMNTKKEIIDKIYYILGEDQSATIFDKEGEIMPRVHGVIDSICRCKVSNIMTGQAIKGGLLDFIAKEKRIKVPKSLILGAEIDEESESITVSNTSELKTEGIVAINGNIIRYDGKTETELLNITGVNGWHKAGSQILFAFGLGEEVIQLYDIWNNESQTLLNILDHREEIQGKKCCSIKVQNGKKYLLFHNLEGSVSISFSQKLEKMESDDDECGFPDEYGVKIIPYLVVGELLIDTSERAKGIDMLNIGYNALEDMYSFYATPNKARRKTIKSRGLSLNHW